MADLVTIEANKREDSARGKSYCRKLRQRGLVPGIIIEKGKTTAIEINPKLLGKAYKLNDKQFNLQFEGATRVVKIQEIQINPVKRTVLHVDLMYV